MPCTERWLVLIKYSHRFVSSSTSSIKSILRLRQSHKEKKTMMISTVITPIILPSTTLRNNQRVEVPRRSSVTTMKTISIMTILTKKMRRKFIIAT